jgi:hypothetical protein
MRTWNRQSLELLTFDYNTIRAIVGASRSLDACVLYYEYRLRFKRGSILGKVKGLCQAIGVKYVSI